MYVIGFLGNYGGRNCSYDGQTIKTKIVSSEIEKHLGTNVVIKKNTYGGCVFFFKLPFVIYTLLSSCKNVLIFPAQRGIKLIVPFLVVFNKFFKRKLHYVVIGGWLPEFIESRPILKSLLKKMDWIYVETETMKKKLEVQGLKKVCVMPNFKDLHIVNENNFCSVGESPYKFCTFSRVMKEKGIEDAVKAIVKLNEVAVSPICTLDIYGKVDASQNEWFDNLIRTSPKEIIYKGVVSSEKSVETLKDYYALLFPTYYDGEGFAGTLLDAFAAGVPVIVSDWHYNAELVENGVTGLICNVRDTDDLAKKILFSIEHKKEWRQYKENCIKKANEFIPSKVIKTLLSRLG